MHALRAAGQRHINAVIDDQWHTKGRKQVFDNERERDKVACGQGFLSQLDTGDTTLHRRQKHLSQGPATQTGLVGDQIEAQRLG